MGKKRMKHKALPIVRIKWIDSEVLTEWTNLEDLNHTFGIVVTVGILVSKSSEFYLIASTYDGSTEAINAAIWIPRVAVKSVQPLGRIRIRADF